MLRDAPHFPQWDIEQKYSEKDFMQEKAQLIQPKPER